MSDNSIEKTYMMWLTQNEEVEIHNSWHLSKIEKGDWLILDCSHPLKILQGKVR